MLSCPLGTDASEVKLLTSNNHNFLVHIINICNYTEDGGDIETKVLVAYILFIQ